MPKTTRHTGPSKADGTQARVVEQLPAGVDLEMAGLGSDLTIAGGLRVDGFIVPSSIVTMPAGGRWGDHWFRALSEASTRLVRVTVVGDSISLGQYATDWRNLGWVGLVRARLQALYGDGGYGYINHGSVTGVNPGGGQVTTTGAWTDVTDEGGITRAAYKPTVAGSGATITFPFRGDTLKIWYRADPSFGTWDYKIDSGSFVPFAMNGAAAITAVTVTGLGGADRTVTVRATTGDGRSLGVSSYNSTGVVVDNVSYGATLLTQLSTATSGPAPTDTAEDSQAWHSIYTATRPTDLVVVALGAGDALLDTTDATFDPAVWDALALFTNAAVNAGPSVADPPDTLVIAEHVGKGDTISGFGQWERDWLFIHSQLRAAAATIGAPFVDVWADGKRSWGYWENLGYWFNPGGPGDDLHPSNAGHSRYAELVLSVLLWDVEDRT